MVAHLHVGDLLALANLLSKALGTAAVCAAALSVLAAAAIAGGDVKYETHVSLRLQASGEAAARSSPTTSIATRVGGSGSSR